MMSSVSAEAIDNLVKDNDFRILRPKFGELGLKVAAVRCNKIIRAIMGIEWGKTPVVLMLKVQSWCFWFTGATA